MSRVLLPCSSVEGYKRFRGKHCTQPHGPSRNGGRKPFRNDAKRGTITDLNFKTAYYIAATLPMLVCLFVQRG